MFFIVCHTIVYRRVRGGLYVGRLYKEEMMLGAIYIVFVLLLILVVLTHILIKEL